jgi:ribosomal protein L33
MAQERYCPRCHTNVTCREEPTQHSVRLYCPNCDKRLATLFGEIKISG